jgi:hypothetical protein
MAVKRSDIVAASVRKIMVLIMKLDATNNED